MPHPAIVGLLLWLCQGVASDGVFSIRLDEYNNPNMRLIGDGETSELCDTTLKVTPCDMKFIIDYKFGTHVDRKETHEYSDQTKATNIYSSASVPFSGAFQTAPNNWELRLDVRDIDLADHYEKVDDLNMNDGFHQIRSSSFNGTISTYATVTSDRKFGRTLTWSYLLYCSTNYYSGLCDKYCKPHNDDTNGHYYCNSAGDKVCLDGFWNPSANCVDHYCQPHNPCFNSTCNPLSDRYTCGPCLADYFGRHCERAKNPCAKEEPCRNGTCANPTWGEYVCSCYPGWTGRNCDADIDECVTATPNRTCFADGTANCSNHIGSFTCHCLPGWSGTLCSHISDYCLALKPCIHGNCSNTGSNYTCECDSGWSGANCDADIDECAVTEPTPACNANGTESCINLNGSFACHCRPGWSGVLCSNLTDYCLAMKPCKHGSCINSGSSGYSCTCDSGWSGTNCDADIDECSLPGYCHMENAVSCVNTDGSYRCNCKPDFEGTKCDTKFNVCKHYKPCKHGNCSLAEGSSGSSNYSCACQPGWSDRNCTEDLNECLMPGRCSRFQACINLPGSYRCELTTSSYWYVFLIIALLVLLAAAAITAWRVLVCRNRQLTKEISVSVRKQPPPKVKWPNDDRKTLDDWVQEKPYDYDYGEGRSASSPSGGATRAPIATAVPEPLDNAEYERVNVENGLGASMGEMDASGTYEAIRCSRMLGTDEIPEAAAAMQQSGPRPRLPDAPRPGHKKLKRPPPPPAVRSGQDDSVYDNSGYLEAIRGADVAAVDRPVSSAGYLTITANPEGYCLPVSAAAAAAAAAAAEETSSPAAAASAGHLEAAPAGVSSESTLSPDGLLTMTANPEGYCRPIPPAVAVANSVAAEAPTPPKPQLPPKPPKVKRAKKPKAPSTPPKPQKPPLPEVTVVDVDAVEVELDAIDARPSGSCLRLNSGDATADL